MESHRKLRLQSLYLKNTFVDNVPAPFPCILYLEPPSADGTDPWSPPDPHPPPSSPPPCPAQPPCSRPQPSHRPVEYRPATKPRLYNKVGYSRCDPMYRKCHLLRWMDNNLK